MIESRIEARRWMQASTLRYFAHNTHFEKEITMGFSSDDFGRVFVNQLRHFDQEMTEVRLVYESIDPDEREELRD